MLKKKEGKDITKTDFDWLISSVFTFIDEHTKIKKSTFCLAWIYGNEDF